METVLEQSGIISTKGACGYPATPEQVPDGVCVTRRYHVRFAKNADDLRAIQRLRFEVFNLELDEGLAESFDSGLDQDDFDAQCHHLMVIAADTQRVVGTYRLMTAESAGGRPFYSSTEFELDALPHAIRRGGVEAGRACVAAEHRNGRVVQLLWRGIARYMVHNDKRFLFGCCSIPTLDPQAVYRIEDTLWADEQIDAGLRLPALSRVSVPRPEMHPLVEAVASPPLPPLMVSYLRLGARVISAPAFDHDFGVSDFLVLLDLRAMNPKTLASFTKKSSWRDTSQVVAASA